MLKNSHGHYQTCHVQRCAKLGSKLGRNMDRALRCSLGSQSHEFRVKPQENVHDIRLALNLYHPAKLFSYVQSRLAPKDNLFVNRDFSISKFAKKIIDLNEKKDELRWLQRRNLTKMYVFLL